MTTVIPNLSQLSQALINQPGSVQLATSEFSFPQVSRPLAQGTRGIASLTHNGRTFRFRTNPNEFSWTYSLNKHVDPTYGGRVVQLLSTKIDDFTVEADCGGGRWEYANAISTFCRDVMIGQRTGETATFEYTTRGWKLQVYIMAMPFEDAYQEVLRTFTIQMKVQEDVSGVMSRNSLQAELSRLQDGVGFQRNAYNDPTMNQDPDQQGQGFDVSAITQNIPGIDNVQQILGYPNNGFFPSTSTAGTSGLPTNPFQGLIGG